VDRNRLCGRTLVRVGVRLDVASSPVLLVGRNLSTLHYVRTVAQWRQCARWTNATRVYIANSQLRAPPTPFQRARHPMSALVRGSVRGPIISRESHGPWFDDGSVTDDKDTQP